jgi:uncharacterized repeat protein (TIGR03803 family)/predicted outer membrane repeat protein
MDWKRFLHHFRQLLSTRSVSAKRPPSKRRRLHLEKLEDRVTPSVPTTTFTVTDLTDNSSDAGSIRHAIAAVNADSSTAMDVINLTGVSGTIVLSNGVLDLTRTSGPVVITGAGASSLTISGNHVSQVLNFATGMNASLSGLTVANALSSNEGAGIYNAGTLSIVNCAFNSDESTATFDGGGGIYNNGTMSVVGSTFAGNSTNASFADGGAIVNNSTLSIVNSTFTGNTTNQAFSGGGAVFNGSKLTITGSTFNTNHANGGSGGAIQDDGTLSLSSSTFTGNTAPNDGGAIYSSSSAESISGCTFSNNSAPNGGAVYNAESLGVSTSTFNGNAATSGNGGGIFSADILAINSSTFSGNSATVDGGGAYFSGTSPQALNTSTLKGNTAASGDGGGVYILSGAAVSILSTIVVGNTTMNTTTPNDIAGSMNEVESAFNLIGTGGSGGLSQGVNNNQVGVSVAAAGLGSLASNGGPTQTISLQNGSAALQAGSSVLAFSVRTLAPNTADNAVSVGDATFLGVGELIQIDNEQMLVTAISGKTATVTRAYNGTAVAAHLFGASVTLVTDQRGFARTVGGYTDVGAVEQNLPGSSPVSPPTFAYSDFKVTDLSDNPADPGSIRFVLNLINADSSSAVDVIDMTGIAGAIVLNNGVLGLTRTSGAVVINGPGAGALTISGNQVSQVFNLASGTTVSLSGLTIANGVNSSQGGGGIYNDGALSIVNSALTANLSTAVFDGGGGIYNAGTLSVVNSGFAGNSTNNSFCGGGAIVNHGALVVLNSAFSGNTITGAFSNAGAIYTNSQATIASCTFTNNAANGGDSGGAIEADGPLNLSGSTFTGNIATGNGGAIYGTSTAVDVNGCTFSGNSASNGGAVYYASGTLTISSSTFTGNSATTDGGAIYFSASSPTSVSNSTFSGNSAPSGAGGAFYIASGAGVSMLSSIVVGNTTTSTSTPNDIGVGSLNAAESAFNLIGTGGSGGLMQGSNNNQVGVSVASANLSILANYGGPTPTIALLSGSVALQAGSSVLTTALTALASSAANTTISVADATFLGVGQVIEIDGEQMQITAISGATLAVTRGFNATTIAAHAAGANLTTPTDQRGFARSIGGFTDIGAVEQSVLNGPIVQTNPVSAIITAGQNTSFTATASGSPTPSVQWQVNSGNGFMSITDGGVYSGSATATLSITGAQTSMSGDQYQAVFTNSNGSSTSLVATLGVDSILTQPINQSVDSGQTATFTAASAVATDTVQWQVNTGSGFSNIGGATTTTLTVSGVSGTMNGNKYQAVFSHPGGTLTTSAATLTVDFVTTQPSNRIILTGQNTTFAAATSFGASDTVQWQVNTGSGFTNISNSGIYGGATSTTLTVTSALLGMNGYQYQAVFANTAGTFATNAATLSIDSVTTQPSNRSLNSGQNTTLTAATSQGSDPVQWQVSSGGAFSNISNTTVYSGATSTTLTITGAPGSLNGNLYRAVFTNAAGTLTTSSAALSVDSITTQPGNQTANAGLNAIFTVNTAFGAPPDGVQWQLSTNGGVDWNDVASSSVYSGATTTALTITGVMAALNGDEYRAVFGNSGGALISNTAKLTVDSITTQPSNQTINVGQIAMLTAGTFLGSPPDTVQWQVNTGSGFTNVANGSVYGGATTTTLTIAGALAGMNGDQYQAVFTSVAGMLTTTPATLAVDSITTQPGNQIINSGQSTTLTAGTAFGDPPDTVQWRVNTGSGFANLSDGGAYSGSSTTTLTISGATAAMSGYQYDAVFMNGAGNLTTIAATLTVNVPSVYPTVSITGPANNSLTNNNMPTLTATAADVGGPGLASVQFQYSTNGGSTWSDAGPAETTGPFGYTFTSALPDGKYAIRAIATDRAGNSTISAPAGYAFMTLATFNGAHPNYDGSLIEDGSGDLFGTTSDGGAYGDGTVFEVAAGSGAVTTLASFPTLDPSSNKYDPNPSLIEDSNGNIFGTTIFGGTYGGGTVFEVVHGSGVITTLASINPSIYLNGVNSLNDGLVEDSSGDLFGTILEGGTYGDGLVFEVVHGSGVVTTFALFNGTNGALPEGNLVEDASGNLFGATGGSNGTVFEIAQGSSVVKTLALFNYPNEYAPGGLVEDSSGNLFGATLGGGKSEDGTVFELAYGGSVITTLASFNGNVFDFNGILVEDSSGNLFGTTAGGGTFGSGTIFEIVQGTGIITVLASFNFNVSGEISGLIGDGNGNFFGTTSGHKNNNGTVFELSASPVSFSIDATPPNVAITAEPPAVSNSTSAGFSFTGSDPNSGGVSSGVSYFQYQLDGGGYQTATSPVNLTGLTNGAYTFQVEAVDNAGNISAPASFNWTVDPSAVSTTTSIASNSVGPLTLGEPLTFAATITGSPSVGTVSFYLGSVAPANQIGSAVNVSGGTATSGSDSSLPLGPDTIIAVYSGGTGFAGSQGNLSVTVNLIEATSVVVNQDFIPVNGASISSGVATLLTDGNSGFTAGNQIVVGGFTGAQAGFDGTFTIATVSGNQVTYDDSNTVNVTTTAFNTAGYAISANTTSDLLYAPTSGTAFSPTGAQRSMVDSIAYTFNTAVNLAAGAVTLGIGTGTTGGEQPATAAPNVVLTSLDGGTIWVATFAGNSSATVTGHSIADGIYTATLNSSLVTAVSGGAMMTTTRPTDTFYRLFGDSMANGHVNSMDSGMLNLSFGLNYLSSSGYLNYFDYNSSGRVNSTDSGELNLNFGSCWYGFAATI